MNKRKRVSGDLFSPSLFSLSLLCFESLFSRVLSPWAFSPVLFSYLLTTRDPEFHRTGVTSWPPGSQRRRWSREKDLRRAKRSPRRRVSVCSSPPMCPWACRRCHLGRRRKRHLWRTLLSLLNQLSKSRHFTLTRVRTRQDTIGGRLLC